MVKVSLKIKDYEGVNFYNIWQNDYQIKNSNNNKKIIKTNNIYLFLYLYYYYNN